jgi:putative copper export protein
MPRVRERPRRFRSQEGMLPPVPFDPVVSRFRPSGVPVTPLLAQLAPAVDGVRVTIHVLAATVWVGGQITVAGLVPTARRLGDDAPKRVARAFSRLSWPAYAVLVATGMWNVAAVHKGQPAAWQIVLDVKIGVVASAGVSAWVHGRSRSSRGLAAWGALTSLSSLAALTLGVFLAG